MALIKKSQYATTDTHTRLAPRDRDGLLQQLTHESAEMRRWAALDLVEFPDAVEILCAHLEKEVNLPVREAILTSLIAIGGDAVVKGLMPFLRSEDVYLRNAAIEALQELPNAVSPYMETMLEDSDPDYRIFAVNVLSNLRHPRAPRWLQTVIEHDMNVNVCAAAVDVLAEVGDAEALAALRALPGRFGDDPFIRFCVDASIRRVEGNGQS